MFDTVFTTLGSVTKRFKVYNTYNKSIRISSIRLARGEESPYRINIDGEPTTLMKNYELLPNDSMYIFVDVTIDPGNQNNPFIQKDSIVFETNGNMQDIKLIAWGQDAHYYNMDSLFGSITWTDDKPYVIFNYIEIGPTCTLTIEEGVEIHSDAEVGIYVWGTVKVNGTLENPVVFSGLRKDEYYKNIPGQWGGIRFLETSKDNYIKNCSVRNATIGFQADNISVNSNPKLVLENVRIENMAAVGLLGYTAWIKCYNVLINNSCKVLVAGDLGGTYEFYHCTFAHYNTECVSHDPAFAFFNTDYKDGSTTIINPLNITMVNSIVWGPQDDEVVVGNTGQGQITLTINNCLMKTTLSQYNVNNNILNKDPLFVLPDKYNYGLDTLSPAINKGFQLPYTEVAFDLKGTPRTYAEPDIGALERKE
jgi:hypothetical protein